MENFVFLEIKKKNQNQQCGLLGPDPAMGNSGSYFSGKSGISASISARIYSNVQEKSTTLLLPCWEMQK